MATGKADERYLAVVTAVDAEFERNRKLHGDRIHCRRGCTDCCYHRFEITGIEAERIARYVGALTSEAREALETRAREYLSAPSTTRLACPALEGSDCSIYEHRPLICHKFGMPIFNPDRPERVLACELNFHDGDEIEDPQLVQIQTGIHQAWKEVQRDCDEGRGPFTVAGAILARRAPRTLPGASGA